MAKLKRADGARRSADGTAQEFAAVPASSGRRNGDEEAAARFLELFGAMKRFVREELPPFSKRGMSEEKFRTLLSLRALGAGSLTALAAHDGLSTPAQCIMLNRLVGEGFATRKTDPDDRRRAMYAPTAPGLALLSEEIARRSAALAGLLAQLKANEQKSFSRAVDSLLTMVGKMSAR